jgi:hypothetical protein
MPENLFDDIFFLPYLYRAMQPYMRDMHEMAGLRENATKNSSPHFLHLTHANPSLRSPQFAPKSFMQSSSRLLIGAYIRSYSR